MPLRVVFMGTPDFAVPTLTEIIGAGHEVAAVYTRAPKPAGRRGLEPTPSPVERVARASGIPVETPTSLKGKDAVATLAAHAPDVVVVVAYGMLLPRAILDVPPLGCLNLHASLLPRWRGAAPIQRAIMAGDQRTGVMVMLMEEGLDTGPVALVEKVAIPPDATAKDMHDRLALLGADLMHRALGALERGGLGFTPQAEDGVTYAKKIDKAETRIDWSRTARDVHDLVRGLSPFPGAWFEHAGERVKVLRTRRVERSGVPGALVGEPCVVACAEGAVDLVEVQRAGGKPIDGAAFRNGARLAVGAVLG